MNTSDSDPTPPDVAALAREALGLANVVPRGEILSSSRAPELLRALAHAVLSSPSPVVASEQEVAKAWEGTRDVGAHNQIMRYRWRDLFPEEQARLIAFARALLSGACALSQPVVSEQQVADLWESTRDAGANNQITRYRWRDMFPEEQARLIAFARALTAGAPAKEQPECRGELRDGRTTLGVCHLPLGHGGECLYRAYEPAARSVSPAGDQPQNPGDQP